MRISLSVVWFKCVFCVCTDLLKTPHGLIKNKKEKEKLRHVCFLLLKTIIENNFKKYKEPTFSVFLKTALKDCLFTIFENYFFVIGNKENKKNT